MRPLRDDVDDEGIYDSLFEFQWVSAHFQPSIGTEEGELVRPKKIITYKIAKVFPCSKM